MLFIVVWSWTVARPFKKIWVGATLFFVGLVGVLHISVAHRQRSSLLLRVVLPCMVSRNECCSRFISTQITTKTNSQQAIILFFPQTAYLSSEKTNPLPTSLIISPDTNLTCKERKSHFRIIVSKPLGFAFMAAPYASQHEIARADFDCCCPNPIIVWKVMRPNLTIFGIIRAIFQWTFKL